MQTRMKSQATEEKKKGKPSSQETHVATSKIDSRHNETSGSQISQQTKSALAGQGIVGSGQGGADREEILSDFKRIQDPHLKAND